MQFKEKNKLNLFSLSIVVISLVIGMGIFKTASVSAKAALDPQMFFAAWIAGGLMALCGALTYAEIGSRYPVTGGYYKIFSVAYHPSVAFAMNGTILVSNAAALGGVSMIGSDYLCSLLFDDIPGSAFKTWIAMGSIALFYMVNLKGLKFSSNALNALMLLKIAMILLIISALFFPETHVHSNGFTNESQGATFTDYIWAFGAALVAVSFTYGGYQHAINFGEEVNNAPTNMPKGIIIGMCAVIVLYMLINYSYFKVIGFEELKSSSGIASLVIFKLLGPAGEKIFTGLLVLAVFTYVNVNLLSNPRIMYAMSSDGVLPEIFKKQHPVSKVFVVSLSVFAAAAMLITLYAETFDKILGFVMILDSIGMAASAATIFYLRKNAKEFNFKEIYAMRLYPWVPGIFILGYLFVCITCIYLYPEYAWIAAAVFFGLIIFYFITKKLKSQI
ncbi:MAG: APC family permease [Saprospiraceae bacterium]|nr:APC family permease [Saprospiraceae bacterium]